MTAIKKTTSKSSKSPAPATSVTSATAKSAAAAKAAKPAPAKAPVAKAPVKKKSAAPAVAPVAKPAAVKPVASKPVVTTITARIDIGFGNALYIRGEGAGLSWDKGLLMTCVAGDQWQIVLGESARPIIFKFLVNDLSWSTGEDYSVVPGSTLTLEPTF